MCSYSGFTLAKGKTSSIYTDNSYLFRVGHDFEMLWKQHGFLTCSGNKILNEPYVQQLLDAILIPATLAIIKISGHSKLGSLEAKGNHLTGISVRNIVLKGTNSSQTFVIVQRDISYVISEKNLLAEHNTWPQKNRENSKIIDLIKRESSSLDQITTQLYSKL